MAGVKPGTEIRLFDPRRKPAEWLDLMQPSQCAVFARDQISGEPRDAQGAPFAHPDQATYIVFERIADAESFCRAQAAAVPRLSFVIYDARGPASAPLLEIAAPSTKAGWFTARGRRIAAFALIAAAAPLLWLDVRAGNALILPTFLAINCVLTGLRLLFWDAGVNNREEQRETRLEEHRRNEQG